MNLGRTHRVPLLLLGLLVASLLLPRACDEAALTVASVLPAEGHREPAAESLPAEERSRLLARIARLEEEASARPSGDAVLPDLRMASRAARGATTAVPARLLRHDVSTTRRSFLIDAGKEQGVRPGLAVIQGDSLVGVVVTVSARAARVLRVDDRGSACTLPATVLAAEDEEGPSPCRGIGVVRGVGEGPPAIRLQYLANDGARVGDLVVTGAGGGAIPEGLLLGEVVAVGDADRDGSFEATLRPLRDLDALGSVLVLLSDAPGLGIGAR